MAMTTDDPNDPATVLRNKIKAQVTPVPNVPQTNAEPDTETPPAPPKYGITDPPMDAPAPAPPPAASPAPVNNNPLFKPGQNIRPGEDIPLADPHQVTPAAPAASSRPTGGKLTDPSFAAQLVAWAGSQPGVNPSVKNDPQYWIGRFTSGAFGDDQEYALKRMMQAEGAPEGAGDAGASATNPFTEQVRQLLMARMGRDTAPVNETDSYIAEPFAAANLTARREQEMERKALAEHAAATGDTSGSVSMGIQQSAERNAVGLGSLKAKLIEKEYTARRADLNDAMQQALASGDHETAFALQKALADLDAQLRREGYGVNMSEFAADQNRLASNQVTH